MWCSPAPLIFDKSNLLRKIVRAESNPGFIFGTKGNSSLCCLSYQKEDSILYIPRHSGFSSIPKVRLVLVKQNHCVAEMQIVMKSLHNKYCEFQNIALAHCETLQTLQTLKTHITNSKT